MLDHDRKTIVIAIRGTLSLEDRLADTVAYGIPVDDVAACFNCDGQGEIPPCGRIGVRRAGSSQDSRDALGFSRRTPSSVQTQAIQCDQARRIAGLRTDDHGALDGSSDGDPSLDRAQTQVSGLAVFCLQSITLHLVTRTGRAMLLFRHICRCGMRYRRPSSFTSIAALRDQVLDLIGRSKVNKTEIMRQVLGWKHPNKLLHDKDSSANAMEQGLHTRIANCRTMLQQTQEHKPIHDLTLPVRLIHLRRTIAIQPVGYWASVDRHLLQ